RTMVNTSGFGGKSLEYEPSPFPVWDRNGDKPAPVAIVEKLEVGIDGVEQPVSRSDPDVMPSRRLIEEVIERHARESGGSCRLARRDGLLVVGRDGVDSPESQPNVLAAAGRRGVAEKFGPVPRPALM